jgi:hypothetical protein
MQTSPEVQSTRGGAVAVALWRRWLQRA